MNGEKFLYISVIIGFVLGFGAANFLQPAEEHELPIDYSDRFDRLEVGLQNSSLDICFQSGGQWVADSNGLIWNEVEIGVGNDLFSKKQGALCIR